LLHQRLKDAVAAGQPVILDGTHSQRPWRLAILQVLELPAPVQWIGWWLTTPLQQCLAWNRQRDRQVEEEVIRRQFAHLLDRSKIRTSRLVLKEGQDPVLPVGSEGQPNSFIDRQRSHFREEGFASVVAIDPTSLNGSLRDHLDGVVAGLDRAIQMAGSRKSKVVLHRYSRLLDLERLIFLIRLLLEFPGVELADPSVEQELRASFLFPPSAPLPEDDELSFASRAAYVLHHRHGPCYGDEDAVAEDLNWLLMQKFATVDDLPVRRRVEPGIACSRAEQMKDVGAGFPAAADKAVFERQFGLLRHLIHHPFDHPPDQTEESSDEGERLSLLALQRRIFLIRLLRESPGLEISDPEEEKKCRATLRLDADMPIPFATRVAHALELRHGLRYGDAFAVEDDLHWLKLQKQEWLLQQPASYPVPPRRPYELIDSIKEGEAGSFKLLQGLLHDLFAEQPDESFDHEPPPWRREQLPESTTSSDVQGRDDDETQQRAKRRKIQRKPPPSLRVYLLHRLADLDVAVYGTTRKAYSDRSLEAKQPQVRTLDKDLELLIKGYGFTTIHRAANDESKTNGS
jgi:hypothetical protein